MTNTTTKTTNKSALNYVISRYGEELPSEVLDKLEVMLIQLEKRSTTERKPSARQLENDVLKAKILDTMEPNRWYSIAEMVKEFLFFPSDMTTQRCSALMTQLADAGKVKREVVKRKVLFCVCAEE